MSQHVYLPITPAYVYKITHSETGQFYYGLRSANQIKCTAPDDDLWITYFTSSRVIKNMIMECGTSAFSTQIIFTNTDPVVCYVYEQLIIKEHIGNDQCLNQQFYDPDTSNLCFAVLGGIAKTAKHRLSMSEAKKQQYIDDPSIVEKIKAKRKLQVFTQEHIDRLALMRTGSGNPFYGKTRSAKQKLAISNAQKALPKKVCPHCPKLTTGSNYSRWHGDNCRSK